MSQLVFKQSDVDKLNKAFDVIETEHACYLEVMVDGDLIVDTAITPYDVDKYIDALQNYKKLFRKKGER